MNEDLRTLKGRGAATNPGNRFETATHVPIIPMSSDALPTTDYIDDASKSIITTNNSPDIAFEKSINPYRGCEHGCVYCYARPTHEYLGYSLGLDFETKILIKKDAPRRLRETLSKPGWTPTVLAMSGVTDPYQPIERRLGITRQLIAILLEFRNPVLIVTKNGGVARDADLLSELARFEAAAVFLSITTLEPALQQMMEPRTAPPEKRLAAIAALSRGGIPTGVMVSPVIPGLTDEEIPKIVASATEAGASFAAMALLRLPFGVAPLFENWLDARLPNKKNRILNRIRDIRAGRLNDSDFFSRMRGSGHYAMQIGDLFRLSCRKSKIKAGMPALSTRHFKDTRPVQQNLFT
ncbi:MAG: PA0069 family radical SAM protein [Nitrospiria bacterium]